MNATALSESTAQLSSSMAAGQEQQSTAPPSASSFLMTSRATQTISMPMAPTNAVATTAASTRKIRTRPQPVQQFPTTTRHDDHRQRRSLFSHNGRSQSMNSATPVSPPLLSLESPHYLATMERGLDDDGTVPPSKSAKLAAASASSASASFQRTPPSNQRRIRTVSLGGQHRGEHHVHDSTHGDRVLSAMLSPRFYHSPQYRSHCHYMTNQLQQRSTTKQVSLTETAAKAQTKAALKVNDSIVYLDGPQVYSCQQCRTHLTSHDDIISKSFQGRKGRAYLLDSAVNTTLGPPEDRMLMTGLHTVCDLQCQRCQTVVGWTYQRAYDASQKYKEGKFIIEKINLYMEESDYYDAPLSAGERGDRWRSRSLSWGNELSKRQPYSDDSHSFSPLATSTKMVYEYPPSEATSEHPTLPLT